MTLLSFENCHELEPTISQVDWDLATESLRAAESVLKELYIPLEIIRLMDMAHCGEDAMKCVAMAYIIGLGDVEVEANQ